MARELSDVGRAAAFPLVGSRVLVTGGSSGIGLALARALAGERASVVITGRNEQRLAEVADSDPTIEAVVCDVTDDDEIRLLRERIADSGGIDMLVNCAGVMHFFDVTSGHPLERQLQEVDIDVAGPIRMVDAFLSGLLERRSAIVNISSGLAWVPYHYNSRT